jgi:ADP-heptose:LPS heptosyltransferase
VIYPFLGRIKGKFPQAELVFITFDLNKGFLEASPAVGRVIYLRCTKNLVSIVKQLIQLLIRLRKEHFDLLINFETFNHASALFSCLAAIPERIGLYTRYEKIFYNHPVYYEKSAHISQAFLNLLGPLGLDHAYTYSDYHGQEREKAKVDSLLNSRKIKKFICFHPGTSKNFEGKRYQADSFAELAGLLMNKYDIPVIFTGVAAESGMIKQIIQRVLSKDRVFDFSGKLTIREFTELLRRSSLLVCADTGPLHIAASLGVNLAVFFGPTSPQKYGPLNKNSLILYKNLPCSPCVGVDYVNKRCRYKFACLDFTPQEAFAGISEKFKDGAHSFCPEYSC